MKNVEQTIQSEFGNSAAITGLIHGMNEWIRPDIDIENFFNTVWNIETAKGFALDIWGRVVGLPGGRTILTSPATVLTDPQFLELILLKALSNISASSAPSINQLLTNWMAGRGRCYTTDLGNMQMAYVFEFALQPYEISILTQSGIFLRPSGVGATFIDSTFPVFGFKEMGTTWAAPFGQAPFGVVYAIN